MNSCCCFSLRQGSFIIGTYALIVYCVAFAVELWWIVESHLFLPAPAYTLCALYLCSFLMAAVLLFGLLIRRRRYLLSWSLLSVLSFFPEAGMVLFMALYYWPAHKYEYALMELVCWAIRAISNILGSVCVCSLYLNWRDEELILARLHDLATLSSVEDGDEEEAGGNISVIGVGRRYPPLLDHSHWGHTLKSNLAYHNQGYLNNTQQYNQKPHTSSCKEGWRGSGTQLHISTVTSPSRRAPGSQLRASLLRMKSEFNPSTLQRGGSLHNLFYPLNQPLQHHYPYHRGAAGGRGGGKLGRARSMDALHTVHTQPKQMSGGSGWSWVEEEDFRSYQDIPL